MKPSGSHKAGILGGLGGAAAGFKAGKVIGKLGKKHGKSHNEADEEDYLYGDDDEESEEADQPGVLARSLRSFTSAGMSKNISFAVIWFSTWVTVMRGFAILS
ncbi:hypothetical protein AAHC03_022571 [Spirometra sp. Aus1]